MQWIRALLPAAAQKSQLLPLGKSLTLIPAVSLQKADAVRVITFTGCMGETYFDNKPIGLWNFREKEGDCKGCTVR